MSQLADFAALHSDVTNALVATTRTASQLANEDLQFHRSLDANVGTSLDRQNARLLGLAERLLKVATSDTETARPPRLADIEAVDGNWRAVVDVIDSLLERADTALDEFTGVIKRLSPGASEAPSPKPSNSILSAKMRNRDISKPQLLFEHVPTNDDTGHFVPLLTEKPHASTPLNLDSGAHPYQAEIEAYQFPGSVYTYADPIPYHPFESTTATLVDTEEALAEMLEELKQAKEIAIDLEHHDQRSYIGIVSLMQISTRDKDWIVDTLRPWRRRLSVLNAVFADPNIVKVLHGAFMDITWLQRDLGLYIVGLFDTHYAARALGYAGGSLAFLLKKFANVDAQKQYQMADWRVRPLPQELFDYARSDTHYLLYIFDCMRNELIERCKDNDKIEVVLEKSRETALQRYEHPVYDPELGQGSNGWYKMLAKTPALLSKEQFGVFRAVHRWRDTVAREQDDSVHYVMPNHQVFSIAKNTPSTKAELLGIAQPATQTVRLRVDELLSVIIRGKDDSIDGPDMMETLSKVEPQYPKRHHREHKAHSVAAFVPQPVSNPVNTVPTSDLPIRSTNSSFWGAAFDNSKHQPQPSSALGNISMSVPLPSLTAEIFADEAEAAAMPVEQIVLPEADPTPAGEPTQTEEDVFILKQLARKRKLADPTDVDGMAAQSDEVALPNEEQDRLLAKAERKRARKEAKREARATGGTATNGSPSVVDEAPFDYANAPSILNQPRESKESMRERRKKEINPYAKSLDAPKGLPRVQKERAGRSMTYK